jgi:murein DD-endopeptidase MepM/ murein hydrolase activator NlpD
MIQRGIYPIDFKLQRLPITGGRRFFASRDNGTRAHAGVDLVCDEGTLVRACFDGLVVRVAPFYRGTHAIEIDHGWCTLRYCELAPEIQEGLEVAQGTVIGATKRMLVSTMLHLEMYTGATVGPLTRSSNKPTNRRSDLTDPTPWLTSWMGNLCRL